MVLSNLVCWTAAPALAADAENYLLAGVATTALYRPAGGPVGGPLGDVSPSLGAGWMLAPTVALELDVGMTFDAGGYVAAGLGPAVVWSFSPFAYAVARLFVLVDPTPDLVVLPGVGLTKALPNGIAPWIEVDAASAVARGAPDLGIGISAGASYLF